MSKLTPSGAMGEDCKALAAELLTQPDLLGGVFFESRVKSSRELHAEDQHQAAVKQYTGARSTSDEGRMILVGALRLLGATDREIERSCGVTRRTIPLLLRELERTGRVTPLKDRLVGLVGDNAERSSLLLRDLMEKALDGEISLDLASMLKAVGTVNSFQLEKLQLLTGQATEIVETRVAAGREAFEAWWKEAAVQIDATTTTVDSKSLGSSGIAGDLTRIGESDTAATRTEDGADGAAGPANPTGGGSLPAGPSGAPNG